MTYFAGNYIIRDSSVFTCIESTFHNIWAVWKVSKYGVISGPYFPASGLNTEIYEVSLRIQSEHRKIRVRNNSVFGLFSRSTCEYYFCVSCSDGLPGIWSIKFWVPFFTMPRDPITPGIVLVLNFHIFVTSIPRSFYLESIWNSLREKFSSAGTIASIMMHIFSLKFFIVMSDRFASIFLSVLIVNPIELLLLCFLLLVVVYVHTAFLCGAGWSFYIISSVWN